MGLGGIEEEAAKVGADNPQVYGIATVFEGRVFNPIYWFDTKGAKEYSQVLADDLSIQPHLDKWISAAKYLVAK